MKCTIGVISVKKNIFLTKYYSYFVVVYNLQILKNKEIVNGLYNL